jgi:hypothetical protein
MKAWIIGGMTAWLLLTLGVIFVKRTETRPVWAGLASPGALTASHAFLENNCASCHTPMKGVEANSCAVCHANNTAVLQRQPSAFHANVKECAICHVEHRGRGATPAVMDHAAFARLSLPQGGQESGIPGLLREWGALTASEKPLVNNPHIGALEATLDCAACHGNQDRHRGYFGRDCAQCHGTSPQTKWSIAEFKHPSAGSTDCAQCHQAPPSHYMEHFRMVSMTAAKRSDAAVNECFVCHQTTSWNDIKGVGYYKHH